MNKIVGHSYSEFLDAKMHVASEYGFDPVWMPSSLFPFQVAIVEWALRKGRAAIFADCGLGKTPMQLTWAENVARVSGGRVLILTPLAVSFQTVNEGEKFGIEVTHRRDGIRPVIGSWSRITSDFTISNRTISPGWHAMNRPSSKTLAARPARQLPTSCASGLTVCFARRRRRRMIISNWEPAARRLAS